MKAAASSAPLPSNEPPRQGGRRSGGRAPAGADDGPTQLRIDLLYPEGPAAKAGLVVGDWIVGVGSRKFKEGSLAPLAKALVRAESSKGVVTLLVQRGGKGKAEKVDVTIPVGGAAAKKPLAGPGRAALWKQSLTWLAQRQQEDGGFVETLSGKNGAVIQAAMAGLAWLGGGSDLKNGAHKDNVRRAADFVIANVSQLGAMGGGRPGGANWNQANWGYAHAAMFLGELHARTPDEGVRASLHFCAKRLVETQETSGGWAHGPGGKNALNYLELNIVTGLALCGLGAAQQSGFEVPESTIEKAEAYLIASGGGDGGIGYSTSPGQKGSGNIGRTAAAWIGYLALGKRKSAWAKKMAGYVKRNADEVMGGHASLMQHILLAGVAAQAHGKGTAKTYWKTMERDLVLARAPDGSFQPRPWHESLSMGSNSDVTFGEVWTTAAWTMVLVATPSKEGAVGYPALTATR
ncbi:MAG: DUF6288 domain-containing protein [Planctomycetota bacterium]